MMALSHANAWAQTETFTCEGATDLQGQGTYAPEVSDDKTLTVKGLIRETSKAYIIGAEYLRSSVDTIKVTQIGDGSQAIAVGNSNSNNYVTNATSMTIKADATIKAKAFSTWTGLTTFTIDVETEEPLVLESDALPAQFSNGTEGVKIVVPTGMLEKYAAADVWKEYANVMEDASGKKTSMEDIEGGMRISAEGRTIVLSEEADVRIYNVCGRLVYDGRSQRIDVAQRGIYIVLAGKKSERVVVR